VSELQNTVFMKKRLLLILLIAVTVFTACAAGRKTKKKTTTKSPTTASTKGLTSVSMRRGACFGRCPEYVLTINSNGMAEYKGIRSVEMVGVYQKDIGTDKTGAILKEFMDWRVDTCAELYRARMADLPGLSYEFTINGKKKSIGNANFGPRYLISMSEEIDRVATPDKTWKKISSTIPE
jgi:hypothetical protein